MPWRNIASLTLKCGHLGVTCLSPNTMFYSDLWPFMLFNLLPFCFVAPLNSRLGCENSYCVCLWNYRGKELLQSRTACSDTESRVGAASLDEIITGGVTWFIFRTAGGGEVKKKM